MSYRFEKTKNNIFKATLPLGVPINQKFFVVKGRNILSKSYRTYKKDVSKLPVPFKPITKVKGAKNVACEIIIYDKDNRRDVDSTVKVLFDVCNGRLWDDDSQIWKLSVIQLVDKQAPRVEISCIEELRDLLS